ncbi:unnamed protein product [Dicrocoelium dendriticum]|nr:unnamed protein product [Dicrocoelium dendriticum]
MESSESIDQFSYEFYLKDYLSSMVKKLRIGADNVLVSVVLYSDRVFLAIKPELTYTLRDLLMAIRNLPYLGGTSSLAIMEQAIVTTLIDAFPPRTSNADTNTTRVLILLTAGHLTQWGSWMVSANSWKDAPLPVIFRSTRRLIGSRKLGSIDGTEISAKLSQLRVLQDKMREFVDHVFCIGLKGVDPIVPNTLVIAQDHVVLLDDLNGYEGLTLDTLDPTQTLCPSDAKTNQCMQSKSQTVLQNSATERTNRSVSPVSILDSLIPPELARNAQQGYMVPHRNLFENTVNADFYGRWSKRQRLRKRLRTLLEVLLREKSTVEEDTNGRIQSQTVASGFPISGVHGLTNHPQPWPLYSENLFQPFRHEHYRSIAQTRSPPIDSSGLDQRANLMQPGVHDTQQEHPVLGRASLKPRRNNNGEVHVLSHKEDPLEEAVAKVGPFAGRKMGVDHISSLNKQWSNQETQVTTTTPDLTAVPQCNGSNHSEEKKEKSTAKTSLSSTALLETDAVKRMSNAWEDSAQHGGAILMLLVLANSGRSFTALYSTAETTNDVRTSFFKHAELDQWTLGSYQRVMLELRKSGRPVVRLTFNAEHADRYTWFRESLLIESYPWHEMELLRHTIFLRSRNEPFSIVYNPASVSNQDELSMDPTCPKLRGYLLILDADTTVSACPWLHNNATGKTRKFPIFIYTLPTKLWSGVIQEEDSGLPPTFADSKSVDVADELRIYASPYSLMTSKDGQTVAKAYPLLFALDVSTGISFANLWHQRVTSPPGYHPLKHSPELNGTQDTSPPCQCWYRSKAVENWRHPTHRKHGSPMPAILVGFQQVRVQISDSDGNLIAQLIFDSRGSSADTWFSPTRLRSSWPWTMQTLLACTFVQFGMIINPTQPIRPASHWQSVGLWIGALSTSPVPADCLSLLLVMEMTNASVPSCLSPVTWASESARTMIRTSNTLAKIGQMQSGQQIAIWSQ